MPACSTVPFDIDDVHGDADGREVADLALELEVGAARARPGSGTRISVTISFGCSDGHERPVEELVDRDRPLAVGAPRDELAAHREHAPSPSRPAGRRARPSRATVPRLRTIGSEISGAASPSAP